MKVFKAMIAVGMMMGLSGCWLFNPQTGGTGGAGATEYTLTVSRTGTGSGTITSSIPGIDCGDTCSSNYAKNTNVLLIAAPSQGSKFSGWSGACGGNQCTVSVTADKTVYATFQPDGGSNIADVEKPTVTISSPAPSQAVSSANLIVTGTANDNTAVTNLEYSLNNAPRVSVTPSQNYSFQVTLAPGSNTINVYAKDATGNEGISSINITHNAPDITNPTVSISSPGNGQTLTAATIRLIGSASDAGGIANIQYAANGSIRVDVGTAPNFEIAITLRPGVNTITVYATDNAGNVGSSSITVTYLQPSFTITPEQNVFFVGQKSVAFWKVNIAGRQNFNTSGAAFDSVTLENNAILGTGASKIQYSYRKADSSQDEIVLEIGAGSSVPVGDYFMTVRATSGSIVKESAVTVRVAPCSLGCQ
jgi:Divergent InlB B-repeat domain/Glucodextranase, domain B